jgi:hypothetical protein
VQRRRTLIAAAAAVAFHLVALAFLTLGLKAAWPPVVRDVQSPVIATLLRRAPPRVQRSKAAARPPRTASGASLAAAPEPTPAQPAEVQPGVPPAALSQEPGPLLGPRLRAAIGCAHPEAYHLTDEEKSRCQEKLAEAAGAAAVLPLNTPSAKVKAYEREATCRRTYLNAPIPIGTSEDFRDTVGRFPKECNPLHGR